MKSNTALAATLFALTSLPLLAQQSYPSNQTSSPATQQNPAGAGAASQTSPAASAETSTAEMSPVDGELISKLDSKTAKTGDNVVLRTKATAKTASGTEIPKGSKLVGRVIGVQASTAGANSQMALQFDHIELKSGQNLPVHSQIQSITPAGGTAASSEGAASMPSAGSANPSANGSSAASAAASTAAPAGNGAPAAGTIVAKSGNIAIQTTSVPDVLLANNAPGQTDPRMASASSILLGAKKDIQLDGGTQMVVGVTALDGGGQ